eukprot:TRINITY_DN18865_c0_g4_i1.p1 TRINITY_DN18865_c0_g4~~TRINITY_DN18865_c0_g4_i1.p1  ORF type:complete len:131 (+),score=6.70 TRINITY_DN18865_c0_g4_i1:90-482(+)
MSLSDGFKESHSPTDSRIRSPFHSCSVRSAASPQASLKYTVPAVSVSPISARLGSRQASRASARTKQNGKDQRHGSRRRLSSASSHMCKDSMSARCVANKGLREDVQLDQPPKQPSHCVSCNRNTWQHVR